LASSFVNPEFEQINRVGGKQCHPDIKSTIQQSLYILLDPSKSYTLKNNHKVFLSLGCEHI